MDLRPEPQGHGSLRPGFGKAMWGLDFTGGWSIVCGEEKAEEAVQFLVEFTGIGGIAGLSAMACGVAATAGVRRDFSFATIGIDAGSISLG